VAPPLRSQGFGGDGDDMFIFSVAPPHPTSMRRCVDAVMTRVLRSMLGRMTDASAERSGVCAEVPGHDDYSSAWRACNIRGATVWGMEMMEEGRVKCVGLLGSLSSLGSSHGESSRADRWRKVASAGGQPGRLGNWLGLLLPFGQVPCGQVPQVSPLNQRMLLRVPHFVVIYDSTGFAHTCTSLRSR
jgi:hypothetical protein